MKNILLLFGGKSFEHDISIITALIVKNQYRNGKYHFVPVFINKNNEWFYFAGENLSSHMFKDFEKTHKKDKFLKAYLKTNQNCLFFRQGLIERKIEIFAGLNCCHGGMGENGVLSCILQASNIPISSGNHTALGICMDKVLSKYCFEGLKIPNLDYFVITKKQFENKEDVFKKANEIGFPIIVKPANLGSSIGISIAKNQAELVDSLQVGFEFDNVLLCEKAIVEKMSEFNIACLKHNGEILLSEIDKPIKSDEILSFKDKYIGNVQSCPQKGSQKCKKEKQPQSKVGAYVGENRKFCENIPEKVKTKLKQIAKKVYAELDLSGVCRIDFIVDKKNNVFLNEINAVPGSLGYYFFVPKVFKTMNEFVDGMIDECVLDFEKEKTIKKEYITKLFS